MSGAYGDFLQAFPELYETCQVFDKEDKTDIRTIRCIHLTQHGDGIKRRKYTSGNTGLDITGDDQIFVLAKYMRLVNIGTYVLFQDTLDWYRLTKLMSYKKAAGYAVYKVELVTGATADSDADLNVKEPYFA